MKVLLGLLVLMISIMAQANRGSVIEKLALQVIEEKKEILNNEKQKRSVLSDLYSVNKNLKKINGDRSKIEKNLKRAEENVGALTQIIAQLEEKIRQQRARLRNQMKVLAKFQGQNVARLLFMSHSSSELDANMKIIRILSEKDLRLLKAYKENIRVNMLQKSKLDSQERKYAILKKSLDEKERHLASQLDKKSSMLKSIDSSRILHVAELKRLRLKGESTVNSERELKKIKAIEDLLKPQMFEQKGALIKPVEGSIIQKYGIYRDEESRTKTRFKGHLINAKNGAAIKAVFRGQVVFSGWLDGYGQTVIIDHGDQYFTVYANGSNLEVKVGDSVKTGTILGYVNETVSFLGKGLYFELRHFSEPEDPSIWIKGS